MPAMSDADSLVGQEFPPIRVLYVFPGPAVGSSMIFAKKQVDVMADYNVASEIFALESRTSPGRLAREARRFRERIALFRPDLMHAQYGTMTAFFASLAATVPLVITFRGSDLNPRPHEWWFRGLVARWLSQAAAARAAGSICVSEQLKRRLKAGRGPTIVLPSGVDTRTFIPRPRDEARRELGWGLAERIVIFNTGAWPAVKRLDLAQAGINKAEALCGPIRFVTLDGSVDPPVVATMLNAADALLMTSDWEGSPTIVQEALACDLPVVSVDVGDVRERLTDVSPSRVVGRDADEIGTALAEILRTRMRSNGSCGIDHISQWTIARQTVALYQNILGRGGSDQYARRERSTAMGAG